MWLRHNHTPAIQSPSESHNSNRLFAHSGVTEEYPVPLRCSSQVVTRGRAAGMRKPSQEISQIPLLYHAICGIRIIRDQLLSASSPDYVWTGDRL
jgi:hypothetical protein